METAKSSRLPTSGSALLPDEGLYGEINPRRHDNRRCAFLSQLSPHTRSKIISSILVLFLVVSLAVNVFFVVIVVTKATQSRHHHQQQQQHGDTSRDHAASGSPTEEARTFPLCVPCSELGVLPPNSLTPGDLVVEGVKVVEVGGGEEKLCCQQYPSSLDKLVRTLLLRTWGQKPGHDYSVHQPDQSDVSLSLPPGPSAHLYLASPPSQHSSSPVSGLRWTTEVGFGTAHLHGDVSMDETTGGLRVPKAGVYFLYSFLSLREGEETLPGWAHYVSRRHPRLPRSGPEYLLLDKIAGPGGVTRSSFLCANLKLRKGDIITVNVSDASRLQNFWPSNFMGLYLLP